MNLYEKTYISNANLLHRTCGTLFYYDVFCANRMDDKPLLNAVSTGKGP